MLETSIGAIARLRDFEATTEVEDKEGEDLNPPEDWPSRGLLEIEDVTTHYKYGFLAVNLITANFIQRHDKGPR